MKKSAKEYDGSYWYELSKKEVSDLVLKKYRKIIKPSENCEVIIDDGVAIMVSPKKKRSLKGCKPTTKRLKWTKKKDQH